MTAVKPLLAPLSPWESIRCVTLEGPPQSKQRARRDPRSGRWFTPKATRHAEAAAAWQLKAVGARFDRNVAVACVFYLPTRRPIDADNLLKLVLDAGTQAGLWHDDRQVTATVAVLEYDPARPRTEVAVGTHASTMRREGRLQAVMPFADAPRKRPWRAGAVIAPF